MNNFGLFEKWEPWGPTELAPRELLQLIAYGAAICASVVIAHFLIFRYDVDDAWIHLRIAQNWSLGYGPVWNVGERVEASTSPAWLALLALGMRFGLDGPGWANTLCFMSAALAGSGVAVLAGRLTEQRRIAAGTMASVFTATCVSFCYWSGVKMEFVLASALLVWTINLCLSARTILTAGMTGLLTALTSLARPELVVVLPFITAIGCLCADRDRQIRTGASIGGVALCAIAAHLLARYAYYGSWVPNTYVAKVVGIPLLARLAGGFDILLNFVKIQPVLFVVLLWNAFYAKRLVRLIALMCLAFLACVLWTGGDFFALARFTVPIVPLACVLVAITFYTFPRIGQGLLLLGMALQIPLALKLERVRMVRFRTFVADQQVIAEVIHRLPEGMIAAVGIGVIGYRNPDRLILDLVGLADAHIARTPHMQRAQIGHDHSDSDYVLSRSPAFVLPMNLTWDHPMDDQQEQGELSVARSYASSEALLRHPRFREQYASTNLRTSNGRFVRLWVRRDIDMSSVSQVEAR